MITFWFFFLVFGVFIILQPAFLAYIIAFVFIFLGINLLIFGFRIQSLSKQKSDKVFRFGNYEFIKKHR